MAPTYQQVVLADNPVSYWRLGESGNARVAVDRTGTQTPNLITNPSFESDLAGWTLISAPAVVQLQSGWSAVGTQSVRITTGSMTGTYAFYGINQNPGPSVTAGSQYAMSAIFNVLSLTNGAAVLIFGQWLDSGGAAISSFNIGTTALGVQTLSTVQTAPAGAVNLRFEIFGDAEANPGNNASADFYVDAVMVVQSSTVPATFYEGNGSDDGDYIGSFVPNLVGTPLDANTLTNWSANAPGWWLNTGATLTAQATAPLNIGNYEGRVVTTATIYEGIAYPLVGTFTAGVAYTASLYIRGNAGGEQLNVFFGAAGVDSVTTSPTITTAWQRVSITWVPTTNETAVYVGVRNLNASVITFFVNAVQVTATQSAVPFSETQGITLGQTGSLTASSDTDASVLFDGGYVNVPDSPSLRFTNSMSFEAWVKPTDAYTYYPILVKGVGNGDWSYWLNAGDGRPYFLGNLALMATSPPPPGAWSHIAVTYDGSIVRHYLNGQPNGTQNYSGSSTTSTLPLRIGTSGTYTFGPYFFKGSIDEPAVYNYALTPRQVAAHFNTGVAAISLSTAVSRQPAPPAFQIQSYNRVSDQYSGVILAQNAQATGSIDWRSSTYNAQTIYQTFYLPSDLQMGSLASELRTPDLSGFQVMVTVDTGYAFTAALNYTLDYLDLTSGWTTLISGTSIGNHADGQCWFDVVFPQTVPVTSAIATAQMRIGITTQSATFDVIEEAVVDHQDGTYTVEGQLVVANLQNETPWPVTVNGRAGFLFSDNGYVTFSAQQGVGRLWYVQPTLPAGVATLGDGTPLLGGSTLNFRILALVADQGTDFLGNEYRSYVSQSHGADGGSWISPAFPSPFAVTSRYWDVRPLPSTPSIDTLNRVTNPNFEYEALGATSVFAWAPFDNLVTRNVFEIQNTWAAKGTQSLRSTSTFAANATTPPPYSGVVYPGTGTNGLLIKGGQPLSAQCTINLLSLPPGSRGLIFSFYWYDPLGALISVSSSTSLATLGVQSPSFVGVVAPPTAKYVAFVVSGASNGAGTLDFSIDTVQVSPEMTLGPYFDGDTPGQYEWLGQRGHSYSAALFPSQPLDTVVVDGVLVDPVTPNMAFNVYYSTDDAHTSNNMTTENWEQKLWTRVPKSYIATQAQQYVFPEPVVAKYMKLEFTNLPARTYTPGAFAKPVTYKKFPTWVADYFIAQLEQNAFTANLVNVQNDALTLAYDYYLDDLQQAPDTPINDPKKTLATLTEYFNTNNSSNQVDTNILNSINLIMNQFKLPTGSIIDSKTFLGSRAQTISGGLQNAQVLTQEGPAPVSLTDYSAVSTSQREPVIFEQSMPVMYFFLTSRHTYKEVLANFDYNKAYFAGTNKVTFLRSNYTATVDTQLYLESGGDLKNSNLNDFVIDPDGNWYSYDS